MKITVTASRDKAQRFKQIVVDKLLRYMERDEHSIRQLSKLTKISQSRINLLLNPSNTVLDLVVLNSVCAVLGLKIVVNKTKI